MATNPTPTTALPALHVSLLGKIEAAFGRAEAKIKAWFTREAPTLQSDFADAQTVLGVAATAATVELGSTSDVVGIINDVSKGTSAVALAVTAEVNATNFSQQAAAVTSLATSITAVTGVSAPTQAKVTAAAAKLTSIAGTISALVPIAPVSSAAGIPAV